MPAPLFADDLVTLHLGDCLDVMAAMPGGGVDAVVTDPPYGLADLKPKVVIEALTAWLGGDRTFVPGGRGFMSREWDRFVPPPAAWDECYRMLKPGGWLLAFAAPRTADLMGMSIRLAGFSVTDSLHWVCGQGFPKAKSRLKPAHEPIIMARKPTGADSPLPGLDACRVGSDVMTESRMSQSAGGVLNMNGRDVEHGNWKQKPNGNPAEHEGRWPPNLLLTHSADCNGTCAPGCPVAGLDGQSGVTKSPAPYMRAGAADSGIYGAGATARQAGFQTGDYGDTGGASRFFPVLNWDAEADLPFLYCAKAPKSERPRLPDGTAWPTVKPLTLMRWLVRLVTPPGGTALDPFAGTGTTGEAAALEGSLSLLIERDPVAAELALQRLRKPSRPALFDMAGA